MFSQLWIKKDDAGLCINILNYNRKISPRIVNYFPLGAKVGSSTRSSEVTGWGELSFSFKGRIFFDSYYNNRKYDYSTSNFSSVYGENLIETLEDWAVSSSPKIEIKIDHPLGNNFFPVGSAYENHEYFWISSFKAPRKDTKFLDWTMDVKYLG